VRAVLRPEVRHELHGEALGRSADAVDEERHHGVRVGVGLHPVVVEEPARQAHVVARVDDLLDEQLVEALADLLPPLEELRLARLPVGEPRHRQVERIIYLL